MTPLYIPLSSLPAPVPEGTPGILDGDVRVFIMYQHDGDSYGIVHPSRDYRSPCSAARLSIDLTPPPLDANGHPTRIDALPVLVGMLARAKGCPEVLIDRGVSLELRPRHLHWPPTLAMYAGCEYGVHDPEPDWSAAFDVADDLDLTDPNAPRLAVAALLAARVWENV